MLHVDQRCPIILTRRTTKDILEGASMKRYLGLLYYRLRTVCFETFTGLMRRRN